MSDSLLSGPSSAVLKDLLDGDGEFTPPAPLLRDLTPAQAFALTPGSPYCIAQILAHMHYCQHRTLELIEGKMLPYPETEEEGWPAVDEAEWPDLVAEFLAELDQLKSIASDQAIIERVYKKNITVGAVLTSVAMHNAYHCGQIALIRLSLGCWPPEGGRGYGSWPE